MKKRILAICLVLALAAIAITGGTLAYLTDTDEVINTMTVGQVDIIQNERDQYGSDVVYDGTKKLLPMVDNRADGEPTYVNGLFNPKMKNVIDKVITVTNDEKSQPAYIRTVLLFETVLSYAEGTSNVNADLHYLYIGTLGDFEYVSYEAKDFVVIDGVTYAIAVCEYGGKIFAPGETTPASLKQFFLAHTAGNEFYDFFGPQYNILALSQAVQADGFDNAKTAFEKSFGAVTAENVLEWIGGKDSDAANDYVVLDVGVVDGIADGIVWPQSSN